MTAADEPDESYSDEDNGEEYGDVIFWSGPCTCEHEVEEHTWGSCGVDDCPCEAGFEE